MFSDFTLKKNILLQEMVGGGGVASPWPPLSLQPSIMEKV